jgi:hypothetical protein
MTALRCTPLLALALALALALPAGAADPVGQSDPPKTLMLAPGKLLVSDELAGPLGKDWKANKGKWEAADGGVRGTEKKEDMHGAVARRPVAMKDVILSYSLKLDGAQQTTLSFNDAQGHVCRVLVRPAGLTVRKDAHDKVNGTAADLDTVAVAIKPGEWHTLVVELRGPDILATLDGKHTAFGSHAGIDLSKTNFGLTVAGGSACFKGLRVWESAGPAKDWEATKAKLLEGMKK